MGILSLLPITVVITLAILTKRTMSSLMIGGVVGAILAFGTGFFSPWVDSMYWALSNGTWQWMALVCGLFGSLVALFQVTKSIKSFSSVALKFATSRKKSLIGTFLVGCAVFVDEWLSALVVGHAMKRVTDKFNVSRTFLCYLIMAVGTTICIVVPFSTWSAFFAGLYESTNVAPIGQGTAVYISTIPFMFFPIAAIIIAFLIVVGILPVWGPMRKEIARAADSGQVFIPGHEPTTDQSIDPDEKYPHFANFIVPIIVLAVVTVVTVEMLYGIMAALATCFIMYVSQKMITVHEFCTAMLNGFKDMIGVIGIVFAAFALRVFNEELGLAPFVISMVYDILNPAILPVAVFFLISVMIFAAGTFWGMAAISFPVIIPVAEAMGANIPLVAAALVCATAFAANACFYGAEVTLACSATDVRNTDYAKNALPIIAAPYIIAMIMFAIAGHMFP
ncbi:MAG: hypothetical protein FWE32_10485 [Oscillospiraceae bacterium]|nr:hypothetical protein [Oscillospiraceae bacterium]